MSKNINKLMSALSSPSSGLQNTRNSNRRRRRRRNRRTVERRVPRGILAGYGSALTSSFYTAHEGDGCRVRGLDLVSTPLTQGFNISYFITANPATWAGTRISAVALGFQNYRPLKFVIHYRPQVGSTSMTSVFIGTIWQNNSIYSRESIEPSLLTSPGGTYLPAWQSSTSVVPLGGRLPQRMFPIRDPEFAVVPFAVVARSSNGNSSADSVELPGRIFIEYDYMFDNAIGTTSQTQNAVIVQQTLQVGQPRQAQSGWIVDYANQTPENAYPLFTHLTWDYTSATACAWRINGTTSADKDPPVEALVYTQGGSAR